MPEKIKKIKIKKQDGQIDENYISIGADAVNIDLENGNNLEEELRRKPYVFNTVADMKKADYLKNGDTAETLGYYEINDGGNSLYKIRTKTNNDIEDNGYIHLLNNNKDNNLIAELIIRNNIINAKVFGVKSEENFYNSDILNKLFNFKSNINIIFNSNETYLLNSQVNIKKQGLNINFNNSILKLKNNSGILDKLKDTNATYNQIGTMLKIVADNIKIDNLHINGNCENNYFLYNGEKYYGYQPDVGIEGLPNKYITIYGIDSRGFSNIFLNNIEVSNTSGVGVAAGGIWDSEIRSKNIFLNNVTVSNTFRDSITLINCENSELKNIRVYNTQRKGIQLYRHCYNISIEDVLISTEIEKIFKWYPSWSKNNSDAELSGIAIQNPNYDDFAENIFLNNIKIYVPKVGIIIRNYSKNINIDNFEIYNAEYGIVSQNGHRNINIKDGIIDVSVSAFYFVNKIMDNLSFSDTDYTFDDINNIIIKNCENSFSYDIQQSALVKEIYQTINDIKFIKVTRTNQANSNIKTNCVFIHSNCISDNTSGKLVINNNYYNLIRKS